MATKEKTRFARVTNSLVRPMVGATFVVCSILVCASLNAGGKTGGSSRTHVLFEKSIPQDALRITAIRNVDSQTFPANFEIEVQNVSKRPIYFISAIAFIPDARVDNMALGMVLSYGNPRLMTIRETERPGDVSVDAGSSCILRLDTAKANAIREAIRKGDIAPEKTKRLVTRFQVVSFGDGTGFIDGTKVPGEALARGNGGRVTRTVDASSWVIAGVIPTPAHNRSHVVAVNAYLGSTSTVPSPLQSPCGAWQIQYQPNICGYENCNMPYGVNVPPGPSFHLCWSQGMCADQYGNWYYCEQNYLLAENGGACDGVDCFWW